MIKSESDKKISIALLAVVVLTSSTLAFAKESLIKKETTNEYEMYMKLISKSNEELKKQGMSDKAIKELRNFDFNKEFSKRAGLDNRILKKMGYTDEQINTLKSLYNSKENNVEVQKSYSLDELVPMGIFADLNIYHWDVYTSTRSMTIGFLWEWSNMPAMLATDIFAVSWYGTNNAGQPLNVRIDRLESYMEVTTEEVFASETIPDHYYYPDETDYYHTASYEIDMGKPGEYGPIWWASDGNGEIKLDATGTDDINEIAIAFSYGHAYVALLPGITFAPAPSVGISFTGASEQMDYESGVYSSN